MAINHLGVSGSAGTHPGDEGDLDIKRFLDHKTFKGICDQVQCRWWYMPADADYNGITFKVEFGSPLLSLLHIMIKYLSSLQIPGGPVQRKDQVQRTDFLLSNQRWILSNSWHLRLHPRLARRGWVGKRERGWDWELFKSLNVFQNRWRRTGWEL